MHRKDLASSPAAARPLAGSDAAIAVGSGVSEYVMAFRQVPHAMGQVLCRRRRQVSHAVRLHKRKETYTMPIIPCTDELMVQAESLVRSVFRWMTPLERLSFIAIRHPTSTAGHLLMRLAGVKDKVAFDVYVDELNTVLGTTGLYRYNRDADEAVWVAWFCVEPKARGRGIGQALIDHTVMLARNAGFDRIRLYTSTDPSEASAQRLYEKNGFKETRRKKGIWTTIIYREKIVG